MIGGQFSAYTLIRKAAGSPVDLAIPSDGGFAMPSGITKVKNGPAGDVADAIVNMFLGPDVQSVLATKAFVAPTNPETPKPAGISRSQPIVRAGLGVLRQGARRVGRPLEPDFERVDVAHVAVPVSKRYGAANVLDRVDLSVDAGALVTLLGPSGCGKTTLLRLIAGLATPDEGSGLDRRSGRHADAAAQAQRRRRVPELRAVSAPDGRRQRRLRPAGPRPAKGHDRGQGRASARSCADGRVCGSTGDGALGRPAAARRARAGACGRAERAPVRRGFERARPQPARDDAGRVPPSAETNLARRPSSSRTIRTRR